MNTFPTPIHTHWLERCYFSSCNLSPDEEKLNIIRKGQDNPGQSTSSCIPPQISSGRVNVSMAAAAQADRMFLQKDWVLSSENRDLQLLLPTSQICNKCMNQRPSLQVHSVKSQSRTDTDSVLISYLQPELYTLFSNHWCQTYSPTHRLSHLHKHEADPRAVLLWPSLKSRKTVFKIPCLWRCGLLISSWLHIG